MTEENKQPEKTETDEKEKTPQTEASPDKVKSDRQQDNIVFVGSKPLINYVKSISMQLKNSPEVVVKARGKFITKAIDIVEVAKRAKLNAVATKDIQIGTEEYEAKDKDENPRRVRVSTLDITLVQA